MEYIWYVIASLGAGIGTGLAGLSAATVMVPNSDSALPVVQWGVWRISGDSDCAGIGYFRLCCDSCNCRYLDEHILSGGVDTIDYFTYKAFRYINVKTDRDNLNTDSFCVAARNHEFREKIAVKSDINLANMP